MQDGPRTLSSCTWIAILFTLSHASAQLAYLQQNSAVNPFQGQGTPPEGFDETQVQVYFVLNRLLSVDEDTYSFKANFWYGMIWEDPTALDTIASNTLSDPTYVCQAWCSTEQGTDIILEELDAMENSTAGTASCCDNVYVPGSIAQNVMGFDVQSVPVQYQLTTLDNGMVSYRVQVQGDFYTNYNFKSYPFDRHALTINVETHFQPQNLEFGRGADFLVLYAENYGNALDETGNQKPISVDIYNSAQLSQGQSWQIDSLSLNVMNYTFDSSYTTTGFSSSSLGQVTLSGQNTAGVAFTIHISRTSKGFYALMIIVPVSLIILFSFVIFILPVTQIKGRLNIVATLFLTLIVLQFVLEGIMPQSYTLMPPYYLLLVSYVYIFALVGLAICTNSLALQWQRRGQHNVRKAARRKFWNWVEELPLPTSPGSGPDNLPMHHNPMTDSKQTMARILHSRPGVGSKVSPPEHIEKQGNGHLIGYPDDLNQDPHAQHDNYADQPLHEVRFAEEPGHDFHQLPHHVAGVPRGRLMDRSDSLPWSQLERGRIMTFLLRSERIRWWSMWWHFLGLPESKEYCEYCANKVEHFLLPVMFVSYAVVVAVIFGVAQAQSTSNRDRPVG